MAALHTHLPKPIIQGTGDVKLGALLGVVAQGRPLSYFVNQKIHWGVCQNKATYDDGSNGSAID
ncbi:hypothetical protein M8C21_006901 [Ambrosia artemisiifolia]|uniref:Uncharacterized protein n=1 Tax=Ambrosia artemisiifolia TaxID=4212 RepID=A0AAD5D8W4_AMBAR|nr:hypothetical protein M8C21_006901 [Ambrosia artemisiifolia]